MYEKLYLNYKRKQMKSERLSKSIRQGAIGGIAGYIIEHGLESAIGVEFINGVFEIAGASLGILHANRDLIELVYDGAVSVTGKEPAALSNAEWDQVRSRYPKAVEYLERALAMK